LSYQNSMDAYPIDHILPELIKAVSGGRAVVLQAPPGSGKTTRVPLALLKEMPSAQGRIIMLEPRRIAAVAAARWMAQLLGEPLGKTIGYTIRFDRRSSKDTRLEVVTEGILTRRLGDDPALEGVAMIIFDEFHERSLQADLALALSLDIQRSLREDLKLLVMSATIETEPIAALLGGAPVISSSGETFPVALHFLPEGGWPRTRGEAWKDHIVGAVRTALRDTTGDILIFLPGAGEIRQAAVTLKDVITGWEKPVSLHLLYGDLPFAEQERAIMPGVQRKIVLATNIAETSLTIEGVRVVIDGGQVRRLQYDPATGMNRLMTVTTSRASAIQRQGRAGRLGPGTCYRLYSRHVYDSMIRFAPSEILTSDLSSLVLDLATWGVTDPSTMAWLDPPPRAAWDSARRLLMDLDTLNQNGTVTPMGRAMARLPLHPRLGRLLLRAADSGHLRLGADLAALLSERDIVRRNHWGDIPRRGVSPFQACRQEGSDISERLSMLQHWRKGKEAPPGTDLWALQSVERTAAQLRELAATDQSAGTFLRSPRDERSVPDQGLPADKNKGDVISSLLLHAYPDRIAQRRTEGGDRYLLAQGRGVRLPRGSVLGINPFLVAVHLDSGEKAEGTIHMAEPVAEETIREEMGAHIETTRRVEWNRQEGRITSFLTERLGALTLSAIPFSAPDEEVIPILCQAIRSGGAVLTFGREARQLQGRIALLRRTFPGESWPDLSEEALLSSPEAWLSLWLAGIRLGEQLAGLPLLPPLKALLSREQRFRLDKDAPTALVVPSGRTIVLDYTAGELPLLAVKLQELFGLAATPTIAGGRVAVLVHLLSPAGRPVQITQDLKGFWESGYPQVKKELQGRYPKHPWPDDPWKAVPTHRISRKSK
jgi:ATP-dependent helicase HrpB